MNLEVHEDVRGKFVELYKDKDFQVSMITTNPGYTRGNHYHKVQTESFMCVKGTMILNKRNLLNNYSDSILLEHNNHYSVNPLEVHNIENIGDDVSVVLLFTNKPFDPEDTDTYPEVVE